MGASRMLVFASSKVRSRSKTDWSCVTTGSAGSPVRSAGMPSREVDDFDRTYLIAVHRAQGLSFDAVVVPVVAFRVPDRSLVYTAVTRGIEKVDRLEAAALCGKP